MREARNPFRLRASEYIESETTFLRLFSPDVLDVLPNTDQGLWDRVQIFRSAPGGGKTSLLRAFTAGALVTLHASRSSEDLKDVYRRLAKLGVIGEDGPQILGVMLSCGQNYATLEDLAFDQAHKDRLLFGLLNSRLTLAALRACMTARGLEYPGDLSHLSVCIKDDGSLPAQMPLSGTGIELYKWAREVEQGVCDTLDSFDPPNQDTLKGHDTLHALALLRPEGLICDGTQVAGRVLVMIDDLHKLTSRQRQKLLTTVVDFRAPVGVWLAERLEALSPDELLATGATTGREYGEPIILEDYWRSSGHPKRFENAVTDIADRRVKAAQDVEGGPFSGYLHEGLDGSQWHEQYDQAIAVISERVRSRSHTRGRYGRWINGAELAEGTPRERAIAWRRLEILIERDAQKPQKSFDFPDLPLPPEELERRDASAVRAAAEFLLSQEFGLPYYFGMARLAALSSSNIEQFLALSGDLFEEIVAAELLRRPPALTPTRQEGMLRREAKRRWDEVPRRVPDGRDVRRFLEAVRQCGRWETNRPNAPYAPGVTGIAVSMSDRAKLLDPGHRKRNPGYDRLARVLSACIAHNLLEVALDRPQGQKDGKTWMILYLNRLLCLHFELPLGYGGWRPKSPDELCRWLERGFLPPKGGGPLL